MFGHHAIMVHARNQSLLPKIGFHPFTHSPGGALPGERSIARVRVKQPAHGLAAVVRAGSRRPRILQIGFEFQWMGTGGKLGPCDT